MFLIPYNKLTEDQKGIIRRVSRESSNLFVEGPPGSGKTLISLYTIKNMVEDRVTSPLVLIYNHSLYGYLSSSFKQLGISDNITIATKDKFFWDLARQHDITARDGRYEEKYDFLLSQLLTVKLTKNWDIAVIDEVQDLNRKEWALIKKIARRITSMGDFNQGIYETDLTKTDITSISRFEQLFDIFRFHKNIAKIAGRFSKQNDNLEKKVKKIDQKQVQFVDVNDSNQEANEISKIIRSLLHQKNRIGLISPSKQVLDKMQYQLNQSGISSIYFNNNRDFRNFDFASNTPLLISSYSAKGLEFENVIVFGFNKHEDAVLRARTRGNLDEMVYVSLTRANSGLYIVRNPETIDEIKNLKQEETVERVNISLDDIFG